MGMTRRLAAGLAVAALAAGTLLAAGCGDDEDNAGGATSGGGGDLSGTIAIDGSSTVAPLTSAVAEAFNDDNPDVDLTVGTSGTGGGFEVFCAGETAISNASRAIEEEEVTACEEGGVDYVELRVASDGIAVVTGAASDVGPTELTLEQLAAVWGPDSTVDNWSEIPGGSFNDVPLELVGPDSQSGTFDFFNEEVLGEDPSGETIVQRQGTSSPDDNVLVRAAGSAPGAMAYFGFSYYQENSEGLKLFSLDGVTPSPETINDGSYPLSRPLYIYVNSEDLARPEVEAFVRYYLENATATAEENLFVPAPQEELDAAVAAVDAALAGAGGGSGTTGGTRY
jgi:phosphate transport system substrate-binding protein